VPECLVAVAEWLIDFYDLIFEFVVLVVVIYFVFLVFVFVFNKNIFSIYYSIVF
jgi:hypothetical protein